MGEILEWRREAGHEVHALAAIGKEEAGEQHGQSHAAGEQNTEDKLEGPEVPARRR